MLSSTENVWYLSAFELAKQLRKAGIEVLGPLTFEPGHSKDAVLGEIKRSGMRFVILMAFDADTQAVALRASSQGMTSAGRAWMLVVQRQATWRMHGWLFMQPFIQDTQGFRELVSHYAKPRFNITTSPDSVHLPYSVALHDAVMLYAHAATKVLSEGGVLEDNGLALMKTLQNTTFEGVGGGTVALDKHSDRIESYEVMNYIAGSNNATFSGTTLINAGHMVWAMSVRILC